MAASASDIRAGGVFVEIYAKMSALDRGLMDAGRRIQRFGATVASLSMRMIGLGVGMIAPLVAASVGFANAGTDLARMSTRTGVAVETLSELSFALGQSGASLSDFESALASLNGGVRDAVAGNVDLGFAFTRLGLNLRGLMQMDASARFFAVADALSRVPGPANRAALAMQVFGGAGRELLPFLAQGADGMRALQDQARSLGVVMSNDDAQGALRLNMAFSRLLSSFRAASNVVGAALAPTLLRVAETLSGVMTAVIEFTNANRGMVVAFAAIAVGVVAFGALGLAIGVAMQAVGAFIALGTVWMSTTAILLRNIGSLAYYFRTDLAAALNLSTAGFRAWLSDLGTTFEAVVALISAGNIEGALAVVTAQLAVTWQQGMNQLVSIGYNLRTGWDDIASGMALAGFSLWDGFRLACAQAVSFAIDQLDNMFQWMASNAPLVFGSVNAGFQGMFGTRAERQAALALIQQEMATAGQDMANQLGAMSNEARRRRDAQQAAEMVGPNAELVRRQEALARLRLDAIWAQADRRDSSPASPNNPSVRDNLEQVRQQVAVRGTFDARGLGDIAASRLDQQQLRVMQQQLAVLVQIERNAGKEVAFG